MKKIILDEIENLKTTPLKEEEFKGFDYEKDSSIGKFNFSTGQIINEKKNNKPDARCNKYWFV